MNCTEVFPMLNPSVVDLAAIWLAKPLLLLEGGRECRISPGVKLDLPEGKFEVTRCMGTIYSTSLSFEMMNLKTGELVTYNLDK